MFNCAFMNFLTMYELDPYEINKYITRGARIGKILRKAIINGGKYCRHWKDGSLNTTDLDQVVHTGIVAYKALEYAERIRFLSTEEEISEMYNNPSLKSCMTGEGKICGMFYVMNGQQMAIFVHEDGRVLGRTVVDTVNKRFVDCYGDAAAELEAGLVAMGYAIESFIMSTTTAWLPIIEGNIYIPYLDCAGAMWFFPHKNRSVFVGEQEYVKAEVGFHFDLEDQEPLEIVEHVQRIKGRKDLVQVGYQHTVGIASSKEISPGVWENKYRLEPAKSMLIDEFLAD